MKASWTKFLFLILFPIIIIIIIVFLFPSVTGRWKIHHLSFLYVLCSLCFSLYSERLFLCLIEFKWGIKTATTWLCPPCFVFYLHRCRKSHLILLKLEPCYFPTEFIIDKQTKLNLNVPQTEFQVSVEPATFFNTITTQKI